MPVPPNITSATAIALTSPTVVNNMQVDDSGTTYNVWYKYTNTTNEDQIVSMSAWGAVISAGAIYKPSVFVYLDPDENVFVHATFAHGCFSLMPITPGTTYWIKIQNTGSLTYTPALLSFRFLITLKEAPVAGRVFIRAASMNQWLIDDVGLTGLGGAFIDTASESVTGFIPQFITGEMGDILPTSGRMLFSDEFGSRAPFPAEGYNVYLYDADFGTIAAFDFPTSGTGAIRTHNPTEKFYICTSASSGSGFKYRTVDANGALGTLNTLTSPGGTISAIAVNNAETVMYVTRVSAGEPIKRWDLVGLTYLSDLVAGVAGHRVTDMLVMPDDTIIACYFKTGAPRNCYVVHYATNGSVIDTYTFTFNGPLSSVNPRLGYASDADPAFWMLNHLATTIGAPSRVEGYADVRKIRVNTGAEIVMSLTPDVQWESGNTTDPPIPHSSDSCPIIEMRTVNEEPEPEPEPGPAACSHDNFPIGTNFARPGCPAVDAFPIG